MNNVSFNRPELSSSTSGIGRPKAHFKLAFEMRPPRQPPDPSWLCIIEVNSGNMTFKHYRSDPVFPAKRFREFSEHSSPFYLPEGYFNDNEYASVITCEEGTEICNLRTNKCWLYNEGWKDPQTAFEIRHLYHSKPPEPTEYKLAFLLLQTALGDSSITTSTGPLEAATHCNFFDCEDLPHDQWILEVRRMFEASLATIQFNVLDIARGTGNQQEDYEYINPQDRGICATVKFKSNGWSKVNFWGLLSLLGLVGGIFLASLRTEESGDLWLTVGMRWAVVSFRTVCRLAILGAAEISRLSRSLAMKIHICSCQDEFSRGGIAEV